MERKNFKVNEPEKEFYFINYSDGSSILVSAIGFKGGYLYFLIEPNTSINDKNFQPSISPITNIIDICGSPDANVISIEKDDPKTKKIYSVLNKCIDCYINEQCEEKFID